MIFREVWDGWGMEKRVVVTNLSRETTFSEVLFRTVLISRVVENMFFNMFRFEVQGYMFGEKKS